MEKIKKNPIEFLIILSILLYSLLLFFLFRKKTPKTVTDEADEVLQDLNLTPESERNYKNIALSVANNLGYTYSVFDPRHWTENDVQVYEAIKDLTAQQFNIVAEIYENSYCKGRDLRMDLRNSLDNKYYKLLKNL